MIQPLQRFLQLLRPTPAWIALAAALLLSGIGILAIQTADPAKGTQQLQWLVISLIVMTFCLLPHPRLVNDATLPVMALVLGLLVLLLIPGVPRWLVRPRNGARCWIDFGINLQPSELAKITVAMTLAWFLTATDDHRIVKGLFRPFAVAMIPAGLVLVEPDLGGALTFGPLLLGVLVASGAKLRHLTFIVGTALLLVAVNIMIVLWLPENLQVLKPHQRERIVAMVSQLKGEKRYIKTTGYQQDRAMTLIGAGGVHGLGDGRTSMILTKNKNYLPFAHNDMIFAVIVNRWGFMGGAGVLGLYVVLFGSMLSSAGRSKDPFVRLTVVGFASVLFGQAAINIGVTSGLLPITGITLPFVSSGGSSLLSCFTMIGLTLNFASRRPVPLARPSFEFDQRPQHLEWMT